MTRGLALIQRVQKGCQMGRKTANVSYLGAVFAQAALPSSGDNFLTGDDMVVMEHGTERLTEPVKVNVGTDDGKGNALQERVNALHALFPKSMAGRDHLLPCLPAEDNAVEREAKRELNIPHSVDINDESESRNKSRGEQGDDNISDGMTPFSFYPPVESAPPNSDLLSIGLESWKDFTREKTSKFHSDDWVSLVDERRDGLNAELNAISASGLCNTEELQLINAFVADYLKRLKTDEKNASLGKPELAMLLELPLLSLFEHMKFLLVHVNRSRDLALLDWFKILTKRWNPVESDEDFDRKVDQRLAAQYGPTESWRGKIGTFADVRLFVHTALSNLTKFLGRRFRGLCEDFANQNPVFAQKFRECIEGESGHRILYEFFRPAFHSPDVSETGYWRSALAQWLQFALNCWVEGDRSPRDLERRTAEFVADLNSKVDDGSSEIADKNKTAAKEANEYAGQLFTFLGTQLPDILEEYADQNAAFAYALSMFREFEGVLRFMLPMSVDFKKDLASAVYAEDFLHWIECEDEADALGSEAAVPEESLRERAEMT